MNKRQKTVGMLAVLLLVVAAAVFALTRGGKNEAPQAGNLLVNGDFSAVTDGMPDGWSTGMWVTSAGASYLEAVTMADGTTAALVENAASNDARFEQTVSVRENATYRLTARVMAENCGEEHKGANVSFSGIYGTSADLHDTAGQWETLTLYARTGKGQREVTVMARLGGYGSENSGKAWFTDVALEQVETVPVGETVLDLSTPAPSKKTENTAPTSMKERSIPLLGISAAIYLAIVLLLVRGLNGANMNDRRAGIGRVCPPRRPRLYGQGIRCGHGLLWRVGGQNGIRRRGKFLSGRLFLRLSAGIYAGAGAAGRHRQSAGHEHGQHRISGADEDGADCL